MSKPGRTLPIPDNFTDTFWEAARAGSLLIQRSPRSGRFQWYPRPFCLDDPNEAPDWVEATGRGVIYSFSVIERTPNPAVEPPFVLAIVELEEGVHLISNVVGVPPEEVTIGMPVNVKFESLSDEVNLPQFTRADSDG